MIVIINISAMVLAVLMLCWCLLRTRGFDSAGWWAFRFLATYCLVCFVYLAYDTFLVGAALRPRFMFIRFGCLALVGAMMLSWHLIRKELLAQRSCDFNARIKTIFDLKDTQ